MRSTKLCWITVRFAHNRLQHNYWMFNGLLWTTLYKKWSELHWCHGTKEKCLYAMQQSEIHSHVRTLFLVKRAGNVTRRAKSAKYNDCKNIVEDHYIFLPFACETLGPWCTEGVKLACVMGAIIDKSVKL